MLFQLSFLILANLVPGVSTGENWWASLVSSGPIGVVLVWFMIRNEPRLRAIESSIDTVSRALLMTMLAMKSCDKTLAEQAQAILNELEAKKNSK